MNFPASNWHVFAFHAYYFQNACLSLSLTPCKISFITFDFTDAMDLRFSDESEEPDEDGAQPEKGYKGPHLNFPLQRKDLDSLIETFRKKKVRNSCIFSKKYSSLTISNACIFRRVIYSPKYIPFNDRSINYFDAWFVSEYYI